MEGLLFDALVASGKWDFEAACGKLLKEMIFPAVNIGIITQGRLAEVVRENRNLIHPGREIRDNVVFDVLEARLAKSVVDILIREVRKWSVGEKHTATLDKYLDGASKYQKEFLLLFRSKSPDSNPYEHPWLESEVFLSIDDLAKHEILSRDVSGSTERVTINPLAIGSVEKVIGGPIARKSILLNYHNVAANLASGSGATGSDR